MEQTTITQLPQQKQSLELLSALSQKLELLKRIAQCPGEPFRSNWLASAIPAYIIYLNSVLKTHQNDASVMRHATQVKEELQQALLNYQKCTQC